MLLCDYSQRPEAASSEPCTVSWAPVCRRTCQWRGGRGLCFCWICSPERQETGAEGDHKTLCVCVCVLFISFLRALFGCWSEDLGYRCSPRGAAAWKRETTETRLKSPSVSVTVTGCCVSSDTLRLGLYPDCWRSCSCSVTDKETQPFWSTIEDEERKFKGMPDLMVREYL